MTTEAWPFVWVRVAALPLASLDDTGDIGRMWADRRVRNAVTAASPALARGVEEHVRGGRPDADRLHRSLRNYHSRMASRATPFGLMSAVFSARLTSAAPVTRHDLDLEYHTRTEDVSVRAPDVDADPVIQVNPALQPYGDGYLVPARGGLRPRGDQWRYEARDATLDRVIACLDAPAPVGSVLDRLRDGGASDWRRYLRRLAERGILVAVEGLGGRAGPVYAVAPDQDSPADSVDPAALDRFTAGDTRVSFDAFAHRADGSDVAAEVGAHAVLACDVLDRINPSEAYPAHLGAMAREFLRRYGRDAEVPLLDVFAPVGGIPSGVLPPGPAGPGPRRPVRDRVLRDLVEAAGSHSIVALDDDWLNRLAAEDSPLPRPPRAPVQEVSLRPYLGEHGVRTEVAFVGPVAAFGGRFGHLLPPDSHRDAERQTAACDGRFDPYDVAELIVAPAHRGRRLHGVVPVDSLRRRHMLLRPGADPGEADVIRADGLLVGVADGRFHLRSVESGRRLHVVQASMVRDEYLDPLEAFVLQVSRAQFRYARPFDWNGAGDFDFRPGLMVGPTLLHPPRWRLRRDAFGSPAQLRRWLDRWSVPDSLMARPVDSDQGVPLRRDTDTDRLEALLRRSRTGELELTHGPDALGGGLIRDALGAPHVAEIVVCVSPAPAPTRGAPEPARLPAPVTNRRLGEANSAWDVFEIALPMAGLERFLTDRLRGWLAPNRPDRVQLRVWWEVDRELEPVIRVIVPSDTPAAVFLADECAAWLANLRRSGEISRVASVGHHLLVGAHTPAELPLAHEYQAADSRRTAALLAAWPSTSRRYAVGAAAHLYRILTCSSAVRESMREALRRAEAGRDGRFYRAVSAELRAATRRPAPSGDPPDPVADWIDAARAYLGYRPEAAADHVVAAMATSLDRMCTPDVLRPHLFGAVRRLLDRDLHETRTGP